MKKILRAIINSFGYDVIPLPPVSEKAIRVKRSSETMEGALQRLANLGISPRVIVDVGAASGMWTRIAIASWPAADFDLVEPLEEQESALFSLCAEYPDKIRFHRGVAGEIDGKIEFSVTEDLDGSGIYGIGYGQKRIVKVLALDDVCSDREGPFLVKLDTHGYEIPIMKGATFIMQNAEALVIEVYGFLVSPTALLFHQISNFLEDKGFRLFDIVDVMRRDDGAFWQADAIYIKADHVIFKDNAYH